MLVGATLLARAASSPPAAPPLPAELPPLPALKSPVDFFRELLAMNTTERRLALTNRAPEVRDRLLAKAREYELMPPELRELRLRATELRWYLVPLMQTPAAQRQPLNVTVPAHLRRSVAESLQQWDLLPPPAQRELIENELVLDYFTQTQAPDPAQLQRLPQIQREKLEADIQRWEAMSEGERAQLIERVRKFFDLTPKEQEKALNTVSPKEREQMEATLDKFEKLPREQRIQCIRSFGKFAGMSAAERLQFLKNAERWSAMSLAERETWRNLVRRLPEMPPLPPDFFTTPPPPLPPLPATGPSPQRVTNGS
jgi:hypothetical protein